MEKKNEGTQGAPDGHVFATVNRTQTKKYKMLYIIQKRRKSFAGRTAAAYTPLSFDEYYTMFFSPS